MSERPTTIRADEWDKVAEYVKARRCMVLLGNCAIFDIDQASPGSNALSAWSKDNGRRVFELEAEDQLQIEWLDPPPAVTEAPLSEYPNITPSSIPCACCDGQVIEFSIPSDIWNTIIRPDGHERDDEYLCANCFFEALRQSLATERQKREQAEAVAAQLLEALEPFAREFMDYNSDDEFDNFQDWFLKWRSFDTLSDNERIASDLYKRIRFAQEAAAIKTAPDAKGGEL